MAPNDLRDYCLNVARGIAVLDPPGAVTEVNQYREGVLPSEMVFFEALAKAQRVDVVIESGRLLGYSTAVLAELFDEVHSIEIAPDLEADKRLRRIPGLVTWKGDTMTCLHTVLKHARGERPALLLDGPKGPTALKCFDKHRERVAFVAIHDASQQRRREDGNLEPNPSRRLMEARGAFFTDDPEMPFSMDWLVSGGVEPEDFEAGYVFAILPGRLWEW